MKPFLWWMLHSMTVPTNGMSDRLTTWSDRWNDNKIGWHNDNVHESFANHGERWIPGLTGDACPNEPSRVLVSLCGKSVDMKYLATRESVAEVVGVDGVRLSLDTFAKEHPDLELQWESDTVMKGKKLTLMEADFFELTAEDTDGQFDAIFDRASLVAIDPSLRQDYVNVMGRMLKPGGRILLVVIERHSGDAEADRTAGPPFSVTNVEELYGSQPWVESVTLLEKDAEKEMNAGTDRSSVFYLIQAKS